MGMVGGVGIRGGADRNDRDGEVDLLEETKKVKCD